MSYPMYDGRPNCKRYYENGKLECEGTVEWRGPRTFDGDPLCYKHWIESEVTDRG